MEFHVSRFARDKYQFDQALFAFNGNVIFVNFFAARSFAQKINQTRDLITFPDQAIKAGQINALGLLDEMLHVVVQQYREQKNPSVMTQAIAWLNDHLDARSIDLALRKFSDEFPPLKIYQGEMTVDEYFASEANREDALEELIMLWLNNMNPACMPFMELFDDATLEKSTAYPRMLSSLHDFFETQPKFGPDDQNLIDMLRAPALANPHSLAAQLEFIMRRWGVVLSDYLHRMLSGLDLIKEEEKFVFIGTEPMRVPMFGEAQLLGTGAEAEIENFTADRDWMPRLVLIAKNAYVWLDQLSRKYERPITHLDQIPDQELDQLARWGFTGLWLIGLWERSQASQRIKQMMGNPDAVASAYSLFDYRIADDLGGDDALKNLKDRSMKRGIRLASDMVPNHMGIDSPWVINHPDWFIALDHAPYPAYSFNTPDLSSDDRVMIQIEDHYFDKSDAAVVFKRTDKWTGSAKYIYHGNDGTSFPWNDTAQLDYLKAEVREAVIQTILHVARQFPIIRFDAAMTLAKKHVQRLWFPEPGAGGAIPSRSEYGILKDHFEQLMPQEFWREVVDRAAIEAPDTLLLAEAFWLMEGYFVRTLGMHRVYNSAFMHILRDEDNAKYRSVMKNTLEFDPEVLKRYVNFMNNPDEKTAIEQFGSGDKYFGICVMLATLPGLPMFGHGQVEGFREKYGMEYRRAYWTETPDGYLIERHQREIFPLLHKRYLFANVEHFLLYDVFTPEGTVDENVFAYSNRFGAERGLVVYHNQFASTRGWIKTSVAYSVKDGDDRKLVQKNLGEGLGLRNDPNTYLIFRDQISGLEYIRNNRELFEQGLYVELEAYQYQAYLDFREVQDNEWHQYARLAAYLNGRGVPSVEEAVRELFLEPIRGPFKELVNAGMFRWLIDNRTTTAKQAVNKEVLQQTEEKAKILFDAIKNLIGGEGNSTKLAKQMSADVAMVLKLTPAIAKLSKPAASYLNDRMLPSDASSMDGAQKRRTGVRRERTNDLIWSTLLSWSIVRSLGKMITDRDFAQRSRLYVDEWLLGRSIVETLRDLGIDEASAQYTVIIVKLLAAHQSWFKRGIDARSAIEGLLQDTEIQQFMQVNEFDHNWWFNKEAFEQIVWWVYTIAVADAKDAKEADEAFGVIERWLKAEAQSSYQLHALRELTGVSVIELRPQKRTTKQSGTATKPKRAVKRSKAKSIGAKKKSKSAAKPSKTKAISTKKKSIKRK
jgi:glycosidase